MLAILVALAATAAAAADGARGSKAKRRALTGSGGLVTAAVDSSHVKLTWNAVPGASSYRVLRAGVTLGQTAATTYTDALLWPRTTYSYEVDALSSGGTKLKALTGQGTSAV